METGADGARRDAEHLARVIEAVAEVVVQDEDRSLIRVEASEAALELIAMGQIDVQREAIRYFRHRQWIELDLDAHPPAVSARLAIAGVDQQAVEPCLETVWVTQRGEVRPGGDERLLGRVLGPPVVPKDQAGDDEEPADRLPGKLGEGVMIACPCSLDELRSIGPPRWAQPIWSRYSL